MYIRDKLGFIPTIFIDDGHGENTPGKQTPDGTKENTFNRKTAVKVKNLAEDRGFRTTFTAPEIKDVKLSTRAGRANTAFKKLKKKYPDQDPEKLAVFVSIHYNAHGDDWNGAEGIETYHYPGSTQGKKLATAVHTELIKGTPQQDRGVKSANFYVVRKTLMPAILIEAGFMTNKEEADLMTDESYQTETAKEIVDGICKYYGLI